MSKTAVIILNYCTWQDTLYEATLIHDKFGIEWEHIIIVDNCSPNESATKLEQKHLGSYIFIKSNKNNGYASGNNIGLRYAQQNGFHYAWILNNDILIEDSNVLDEMIHIMELDNRVAVVNPDIYAPNGYMYNRNSQKKSTFDYTIGSIFYKKKGRHLKEMDGYGYIYRPQGCCMLVDLMKISTVDFMDEQTFLYFEEPILAERLARKGYKCACANRVRVIHNHSKTVKQVIQKKKTIQIQNNSFEYYLKEYRSFNLFQRKLCILFNSLENYFLY